MTAKQTESGWMKRVMDALPLVILSLLGWICFSIIQLKVSMAEVQKDITALLAAKNVEDTATIGSNSRRLNELEKANTPQGGVPGVAPGGVPVVAAPVTVVNPPDNPANVKQTK